MSLRLQEAIILRSNRSPDGRTIEGLVQTHFQILEDGLWISALHKSDITAPVRARAPENRALKKLKVAAWAEVQAFMEGGEADGENIFCCSGDVPLKRQLSDEDEYDLAADLSEIYDNFRPDREAA